MAGDGTVRALTSLLRWGSRRPEPADVPAVDAPDADAAPLIPTKAFPKFLAALTGRQSPVLIDLGPVVGSNVSFFGERLGCKILVEDLFADVERHARTDRLEALAEFLDGRFPQADGSADGILCWDLFDYIDRPAATVLARHLTRLLRPDGALLGFFVTATAPRPYFVKHVIVEEGSLRHRAYAATVGRRQALQNRDIIRMFDGLLVTESFLLKTNTREILFRKR